MGVTLAGAVMAVRVLVAVKRQRLGGVAPEQPVIGGRGRHDFGRALAADMAVQAHDPIRRAHHDLQVVADHQNGAALRGAHLLDPRVEGGDRRLVQPGRRLVEDQEVRGIQQRPRKKHPLQLAAGKPRDLLALNARIFRDFRFRSGATSISTPVSEVLARREGVCQDFTHLMLCGLRGLGLPARYMSGYIRTRPPPGQQRRIGADQSHAWVSAWLGVNRGWVDLDPTNDVMVSTEHVALGWGRDFSDISPLRGIILGGGRHSLHVGFDLRPAAEAVDDHPA